VSDLCAGKPLPDEALAQIERQTDGVPLFIEELTKSLLDSGEFVERDGGWMLSERRRLAVPESLHDSLMSRLDRHRSQKEIAQIASCIGREFSHALLFRIAGLPVEVLDAALSQLQDAELVFKMRSGPDAQYAFKHALVCDAAYESLLKRRREELHARVLAELGRLADTPPELLATHAAAAGFTSQAIQLWAKAAALAMSRNAFGEAASHVGQALRLNEALPSSGESLVERLDLLLALGQATIPLRGYSHSDSVAVFSRAHDLAQELNDSQRAFWVSYARWVVYYVRGEHATAQSIASDMLQRARLDNHSGRELTALRALGISEMIGGAPHAADSTFARADQLAAQVWQQPERRLAVAQRFAADPQIATQFHVALTHWALGRVDRARELSAQAIHAARQMGHVHTLGHALTHGAIVAVIDRDPDLACRLCTEADAVAEKHGMELWRGYGKILHGYALALNGDLDQAAGLLQAGLERLSRTQTGTMVAMHHAVCAWTLTRLGKSEDAAVHERAACAELNDGTERYFWPETLVWLGRKSEQDRAGDGPGQAERLYWRALEEARRQQALGWELRAATALGGLWAARGERGRAADLLSPLLDRMEQGRASALWRDADALVRTTP
jgi:tetratricopeptide (TPR) repeat protein